jgi:type VI protein secretion system component VasA
MPSQLGENIPFSYLSPSGSHFCRPVPSVAIVMMLNYSSRLKISQDTLISRTATPLSDYSKGLKQKNKSRESKFDLAEKCQLPFVVCSIPSIF